MIGTSTEVETGIELLIMEAFDEEKACEHWKHDDPVQSFAHGGNAEWYFNTLCDGCGYSGKLAAVCDKYVRAVERNSMLKCRNCHELVFQTILVKERIKE